MTYRGVTDQMPIESLQALTETIFNLASGKTRDPMDVVKNAVGGTIRNVSTGIPVIGLNFLKQASKFADPASYYKMDGYSFIAGSLGYSVLIPETLSGEEYTRVDHRGRETKYYPGDQLLHYAHNLDLLDNDEVDTWLDANNANYMAADKARAYYSFYLNPDDPTREVGMVRLDEDTRVLRMAAITGGKLMNSFLEEAYPRMRDIENPVLIKAIVNEANRLQQRHVIQSIEEATHENLDIQRLELSTDWSSVKDEISVPVIVNGEEKSEKVSLLKVVTSGRYTQDQMLEMFDLQSEEVMQDKARESAVKRLEK
jgi:ATP:corrinoid adenosyltransferase